MKYYCESGKHLLFDTEANRLCGSCADIARLIESQRVTWRELHICEDHKTDFKSNCISCNFAIDWNVNRRYCIRCGEPATGYRLLSKDTPVEFFCDEHFEGLPTKSTDVKGRDPVETRSGDAS